MKNYKGNFILTFLVLLAFMAGARMFFLDTMLTSETRTIQNFIKNFFLYQNSALYTNISASDLMMCFTAFLFMGYNLNISFYDVTRKHRSMILLRYGSRKNYFFHNNKSIISRSFMITAASVASFFLASWVNSIPIDFAEREFASLILFLINLFLFLNLLGLLNIYCVLQYKDTTAFIITSLFTSVLLLTDAYEPFFAVITYGTMWAEVRGAALLVLCNITLFFVAGKALTKNDI